MDEIRGCCTLCNIKKKFLEPWTIMDANVNLIVGGIHYMIAQNMLAKYSDSYVLKFAWRTNQSDPVVSTGWTDLQIYT